MSRAWGETLHKIILILTRTLDKLRGDTRQLCYQGLQEGVCRDVPGCRTEGGFDSWNRFISATTPRTTEKKWHERKRWPLTTGLRCTLVPRRLKSENTLACRFCQRFCTLRFGKESNLLRFGSLSNELWNTRQVDLRESYLRSQYEPASTPISRGCLLPN